MTTSPSDPERSFEDLSRDDQGGIVSEFFGFMRDNKKWWLTPILVVLLLLGALMIASGTAGIGSFLYTLF
jgi:hypothetical protein